MTVLLTIAITTAGIGAVWLLARAYAVEPQRPDLNEFERGDCRCAEAMSDPVHNIGDKL